MQLVEAQMDRIRFSVRRRSPRLVALVLFAGTALLGTGAAWVAWLAFVGAPPPGPAARPIPPALDCPAPSDDPLRREACAALAPTLAEAPGLFEAYLARRHHHLTVLLPMAFPPSDAPPPRLARPWSAVGDEADHRLVAEIHRDATQRDTEWVVRDPIVGGRPKFSNRILDDEAVRDAMDAWRAELAPLPDRTGATLEQLVEEKVVRIEGAQRALFAAPEGDHVVDRAVADVRRYDALRRAAFHAASERLRADAGVANARLAVDRDRAVQARRQRLLAGLGVEAALALWVGAAVAATLWVLRRQTVEIAFDGHGLRIGGRRLPWDDIVDLTWYEGRVQWTTQSGEGAVRGLALGEAEARAFHRAAWALRNRRASGQAGGSDAADALASLRSLVDRVTPPPR